MSNMLRVILSVAFGGMCGCGPIGGAAQPGVERLRRQGRCAARARYQRLRPCGPVRQGDEPATRSRLIASSAPSLPPILLPARFQDCDNLIARDPKLAWAWWLRGRASWAKGDHERAIADFNEAICLDPKDRRAYQARCFVRAIIDQPQQGLSDCNEALRLKPDDAATLTKRGFVHLKLAQHDLAIADFDAALRLEPRQVDLLYLRGLAKLRKGDSEGGRADAAAAKSDQEQCRPSICPLRPR